MFYKSFYFLFFLNLIVVCCFAFTCPAVILIPVCAALFIFNVYLIFFNRFYFTDQKFSEFAIDDPYQVHSVFQNVKNKSSLKHIKLFKLKNFKDLNVLCFSRGQESCIALSPRFVESFSKKDLELLFTYFIKMSANGNLACLSLISACIFFIESVFRIMLSPWIFFIKKSYKTESFLWILFLKSLALIIQNLYLQVDTSFKNTKQSRDLAHLLWNLASLAQVCPPKIPTFFAPLCIINPLTHPRWAYAISLQPLIKKRFQAINLAWPS